MEALIKQFAGLVTMIGALIESAINKLPGKIVVDKTLRSIAPQRRVAVISVSVTGTSTYTGSFQKGDDVVIDYITAYTADTAALNAFRIDLEDQRQSKLLAMQDKAKDGTLIRPRGSQVLPSTSNELADRPSLMLYWPKDEYLYFVLENAAGTPTYSVELTVHYRVVRPA